MFDTKGKITELTYTIIRENQYLLTTLGMAKTVIIRVARMDDGYSAACDMIDGWVVAVTGDFCSLQKEVKESIEFYLDCAKLDGDKYNPIFDENYKLEYQFDVRSLICYYQKIFSLAALEYITGINQ